MASCDTFGTKAKALIMALKAISSKPSVTSLPFNPKTPADPNDLLFPESIKRTPASEPLRVSSAWNDLPLDGYMACSLDCTSYKLVSVQMSPPQRVLRQLLFTKWPTSSLTLYFFFIALHYPKYYLFVYYLSLPN